MPDFEKDARYLTLPELSPYLDDARFDEPKELFKHAANTLERLTDPDRSYRLGDIGCANGELLYYLRSRFPRWELHGVDPEPEFVRVAMEHPALAGIGFELKNLFDVEERFDLVTFLGTMSTFAEVDEPLTKLLDICEEGGVILVDGYFNRWDVEVRSIYCDNSTEAARGLWRRDWNQHTRSGIRAFLEGKCRSVEFEDVVMGVELPRDESKPHINAWTFRDAEGRNLITNGTNMVLNDVMMVIRK